MKDEQSIENFKKPIFESQSPSNYLAIFFCLIWTLILVLISTKENLWTALIAGIVTSSIYYFSTVADLTLFIVYDDSIIIKYPYLLFHKKYEFTFSSIKGILFDDSATHRKNISYQVVSLLASFRSGRYRRTWNRIIFYYTDHDGTERETALDYKLDKGDLRRIISLLRESGINIKGDEKYIEVT